MTRVLNITPDVATTADLAALAARVTTDETKITALGASLTTLQAAVGVDEKAIAALQAALAAPPPPAPTPTPTAPGTVADLHVTGVAQDSVTLAFTNVDDGTGQPASYYLRYAPSPMSWGAAAELPPYTPGPIGALRSVVVTGLAAGTAYQFQIVAFRGTDPNAIFGALSNVASATTNAVVTPPTPPPPAAGLIFQSDWPVAGVGAGVVTDGGKWDTYDEFLNGNLLLPRLSVVSGVGAPGGRNALKAVQRGVQYAADVGKHGIIPQSTDYWVRLYFRNDDTSPSGDHCVEPGLFADSWANLTYLRKESGASGWQHIMLTQGPSGTPDRYPVNNWRLRAALALGVWYRFEWQVHFVDATHIQIAVRVYDAVSGALLYTEADYRQPDYANTPVWNGSNVWTLASYVAAGYNFPVDPTKLVNLWLANNGQQGAADTGLPWYYAGVAISTQGWIGA